MNVGNTTIVSLIFYCITYLIGMYVTANKKNKSRGSRSNEGRSVESFGEIRQNKTVSIGKIHTKTAAIKRLGAIKRFVFGGNFKQRKKD